MPASGAGRARDDSGLLQLEMSGKGGFSGTTGFTFANGTLTASHATLKGDPTGPAAGSSVTLDGTLSC